MPTGGESMKNDLFGEGLDGNGGACVTARTASEKRSKRGGNQINRTYQAKVTPICKCRCGNTYVKFNSLINKCMKCLVEKGAILKAKHERKEWRKRKENLKKLPYWKSKAQDDVNAYCRLRDKDDPCISCGTYVAEQWDGGHYLSVGSTPELRYEPLNIHKQCSYCNDFKVGNHGKYRTNLIKKIGIEKVEWLESKHEAKHYTIEDLK